MVKVNMPSLAARRAALSRESHVIRASEDVTSCVTVLIEWS